MKIAHYSSLVIQRHDRMNKDKKEKDWGTERVRK